MKGLSKPRKFPQTVELQICLRNYNAKKEKKLAADIDLPNQVKRKLKVICIVNDADRDQCLRENIEHVDIDHFKKFNNDVKQIKKWARSYDIILVSSALNRNLNKLVGKPLTSVQRLPAIIAEGSDIKKRIELLHNTARFKVKGVTWINTAVAQEEQESEQIRSNILKALNFLASQLPKGWQNIRKIGIKTTMGKYVKLDY
jgi:ribosomal protein L1